LSEHEEVQEEEPEIALKVDEIGIKDVKRKILIDSPSGKTHFDTVLDLYVDLPKSQRGVHMSRNFEVFQESIEEAKDEESASLEDLLSRICQNLLEKHEYATQAKIIAKTDYYFKEDFEGKETSQAADVVMRMKVSDSGEDERMTAVTIPGMTVCPSAQKTYHDIEGTPVTQSPSHTQRADLTLRVKTEGKFVRLESLISSARKAFSAPSVSLLKRSEEHELIKRAFERPRFIEDLERHALHNLYHSLIEKGFSKNTEITVEAESYESIHPHNIYARRSTTLGELEEERKEEE